MKITFSKELLRLILIFSSVLLNPSIASAEDKKSSIDCKFPRSYEQSLPTSLLDLQKQAMSLGKEICMSLADTFLYKDSALSNPQLDIKLTSFTENAKAALIELFPENEFEGISVFSDRWSSQVINHKNDYRNISKIRDDKKIDGEPPRMTEWHLKLYAGGEKAIYKMNNSRKNICSGIAGSNDCTRAFDVWENAVTPFQYHLTNEVFKKNGKNITSLQNQWSDFIDESRYQTPLDVWATTRWYKKSYSGNKLVGPPSMQLFLLHPTIVYEHLPDTEKGDKEDVSVALEWGGANWWKNGFGFSITSIYKDRKSEPSVGHGITLHIKNKYSLGYAYRDNGNDSIFFNIDLLEWFGNKVEKYEKYKKYF